MRGGNPQVLLVPRIRPGRATDLATPAPLIANQRHRARRARRARRSVRSVARVLMCALTLAVILVVTLVAAHWLRTAPLLAVATAEIVGTRRLEEEAVRAAAGVEPGANIFGLNPEAIEDRVEGLPGVRTARVMRHLPNRVTVMVEEREPYALINPTGADRLFWIDADGHLVGPERRPGAPPLPVLSGIEPAVPGPDHQLSDGLRTGIALLRAVQRTGGRVAERISEIDLATTDGPVLYMVDGAEVRVGTEAWDERLARLDGVLGDLATRGERVASVDLRFRDLVVLKPRETPPSGPAARAGAAPARRRTTMSGTNLREHR